MDAKHFFEMHHVNVMEMQVSAHAISKICKVTLLDFIPRNSAREELLKGRVASLDEITEAGFRPNQGHRMDVGIESYYFWMEYRGVKMVAVLERKPGKPFVWITTYTHTIPNGNRTIARWTRFPRRGGPNRARVKKSEERRNYFERPKAPRRKPKRRRGRRRRDWRRDAEDR